MKNVSKTSREQAMKLININFKKKTMKLLRNKQLKSYENAKICYICKEKFEDKYSKDTKYRRFRDHCHYTSEYRSASHALTRK